MISMQEQDLLTKLLNTDNTTIEPISQPVSHNHSLDNVIIEDEFQSPEPKKLVEFRKQEEGFHLFNNSISFIESDKRKEIAKKPEEIDEDMLEFERDEEFQPNILEEEFKPKERQNEYEYDEDDEELIESSPSGANYTSSSEYLLPSLDTLSD
jgi:hypothetical protein